MRLKLTLLLAAFLALVVGYWIYDHSYIEVSVSGNAPANLRYDLLRQGSEEPITIQTNEKSVKKLVRRGSYEVAVTAGNSSYFSVTKADGFLGTQTVKAALKKEKARTFLGDNPSSCMIRENTTIWSYGCNSSVQSLQLHVPASAQTPTVLRNIVSGVEGSIEGSLVTKEGSLVFVWSADGEDQAPHTSYLLRNGTLQSAVALKELADESKYEFIPYKNGFIAYEGLGSSFSDLTYFPQRGAKSEKIAVSKPVEPGMLPFAVSSKDESIAVGYSNNQFGEVGDLDDESPDSKTEVHVVRGGQSKKYLFDAQYSAMELCGLNKLCMIRSNNLEVFDISTNKAKLRYKVQQVLSIKQAGQSLIITKPSGGLLELGVDRQEGYYLYAYGGYSGCGSQFGNDGQHLLCVVGHKNKKMLVNIDSSKDDEDSIDKKILNLAQLEEIKDLSVYGRFIHIVPEYGDLAYQPASRSYGYNPQTVADVNQKIEQQIKSTNLSPPYTFINSFSGQQL